jgi:hypothetical protein
VSLFPVNEIKTDFSRTHKLVYGYPKSGKTTLAAQMKDAEGRVPLFIMTEEGLGSIRAHSVRITSWDGFKRLVTHLDNNKATLQKDHSTVVIDVLGDLDQWAATFVAGQHKVQHVSDMDHGKGWKLLRDEISNELNKLMGLIPVTFIAHTQEKEILLNGEKVKTQAPSVSKAAMEFVNGKAEAIIWINPATTAKAHPSLSLTPTKAAIAGSRQKAINKEYGYDPAAPGEAYQHICQLYKEAQEALAQSQTQS